MVFSDAGDRCAIFVASCVLLKSLIMTNQFDVVQVVLLLRRCRANLINSIVCFFILYTSYFNFLIFIFYFQESFKFLYDMCSEYVQYTLNSQTSINDKRFSEDSSESYA